MIIRNSFISKVFSATLVLTYCGLVPTLAYANTIAMPAYVAPDGWGNQSEITVMKINDNVPDTNLTVKLSSPSKYFNTRTHQVPPSFYSSVPVYQDRYAQPGPSSFPPQPGAPVLNQPITYQVEATTQSGQELGSLSFVGHWLRPIDPMLGSWEFIPNENYMTLNQNNQKYSFCADAARAEDLPSPIEGQLNVFFYNTSDYSTPTPKAPDGRLGVVSTTSTAQGPTCPQGAITVNLNLQNFAKMASALGVTGDLYAAIDNGANYSGWGSDGAGSGTNIAPQKAGAYYYIPLTPNSWQQSGTQYQQAILCVYPNAEQATNGVAQIVSVAVAPKLSDLFTSTTTKGKQTYSNINPAGMANDSCQITLSMKLSAQSPCINSTDTFQSYTITCPTPSGLVSWQNSVTETQGALPSTITSKTVSPASDPSSTYTAHYINEITDFMCADDGASSGCQAPSLS